MIQVTISQNDFVLPNFWYYGLGIKEYFLQFYRKVVGAFVKHKFNLIVLHDYFRSALGMWFHINKSSGLCLLCSISEQLMTDEMWTCKCQIVIMEQLPNTDCLQAVIQMVVAFGDKDQFRTVG